MQKLPNSHLEGYPRGAVDRDRIRSIAAGPAPAYDGPVFVPFDGETALSGAACPSPWSGISFACAIAASAPPPAGRRRCSTAAVVPPA